MLDYHTKELKTLHCTIYELVGGAVQKETPDQKKKKINFSQLMHTSIFRALALMVFENTKFKVCHNISSFKSFFFVIFTTLSRYVLFVVNKS